jgi:DNA-binding CsgD family transcriptional regulator
MGRRISSPRFVGRANELDQLSNALGRAAGRKPGMVMVCGEAGVGKSRLLAEFSEIARASGALVTQGDCIELAASGLPYSPLVRALAGLVGSLDSADRDWMAEPARAPIRHLVPELAVPNEPVAPTTESDSRPGLFDAACGLVARASNDRTVLLVIEDLHWADRSTLDLLRYLVSATRDCKLLLGVTVRTDQLSSDVECALAEYGRDPMVDRIDLGRLDWTQTGALIEGIVGVSPSVSLLNRIYERSDGNPFFVEELLAAGLDSSSITPGLRQVALGRVQVLSAAAQRLVRSVAAAGRSVDHGRLRAVTDLADDDLLDCLMEAVRGNVLISEPGSDCYSFRHALVREVVYEDTLPGERQRLHRAYAASLAADAPSDPAGLAELAHHLDRGRSLAAAVDAYVSAGAAAEAVGAYPEALAHLERAIELLPAAERQAGDGRCAPDVASIRGQAARCAYLTGDPERAVALQKATLLGVDRDGDPETASLRLERLGEYLWSCGRIDQSMEVSAEAAALVSSLPPSSGTARVLASRARILVLSKSWQLASEASQQALLVARMAGARAEEGRALGSVGACRARTDIEAGLVDLSEAIAISTSLSDTEAVLSHHRSMAAALQRVGDHHRLAEALASALEAVDRSGGAFPIALLLLADVAQILIDACEWDQADSLIARALGLDGKGIEHKEAHFAAARLAACRGLSADAIAHLDACWPFDKASIPERHAAVRAEILVNDGRWLEAREVVAAGLAGCRSLTAIPQLLEAGLRAEVELAAIARLHRNELGAATAVSSARRLATRLDELANAPFSGPTAWYLYARAICDAEMSRMFDRPDPAAWRAVIEIAETMEAPYRTIYPRVRLAEALLEKPARIEPQVVGANAPAARAEGAAELRSAHALAARIGAKPHVDLALALGLRSRITFDEPVAPKPVRPAAPLSPEEELAEVGLSPREIEVLAVLTEGRTNRQIAQALFIAEKTAAIHVSRILDKLGAANRVEAAVAAYRLGLGVAHNGQSAH